MTPVLREHIFKRNMSSALCKTPDLWREHITHNIIIIPNIINTSLCPDLTHSILATVSCDSVLWGGYILVQLMLIFDFGYFAFNNEWGEMMYTIHLELLYSKAYSFFNTKFHFSPEKQNCSHDGHAREPRKHRSLVPFTNNSHSPTSQNNHKPSK
jgi:hypothetical protein